MTWQVLSAESWQLYSHLGLHLIDEFTGGPPQYPVYADLAYQNTAGVWLSLEQDPVITPSGIISYPALGRSAHVGTAPILHHRVQLRSDFYRPDYLLNNDGIEFDVHPYDDTTPPVVIPTHPQTVLMLPNTQYAHAHHVRVVKGVVRDAGGNPVANVEISEGVRERVLSDERGAFALPLRWSALNAVVSLDALDHRTGRNDNININLPGDLSQGHLFTII